VKPLGRVRTLFIKRAARDLLEKYPERFSIEFEHNRRVLDELMSHLSKSVRNRIAGYISTLLKQKKED
jgi:small subunit ribosomal protein S17e